MSDLPANIVAMIDYDGTWDGPWAAAANRPIEIEAYQHAGYIRDDIFDARISALIAERDEARARAAAAYGEAAQVCEALDCADAAKAIRGGIRAALSFVALTAALEKARAEERERCAKVAEAMVGEEPAGAKDAGEGCDWAAATIAAAIRALGKGDE